MICSAHRLIILACCLLLVAAVAAPCWAVSERVHAFYYPWYRSSAIDGNWIHWQDDTHVPPDNIAAAFYPLLGPYSSNDPSAIHQQMKWLRDAGVGVIATSWWGIGSREDLSTGQLMDIAHIYGIKVCFHMEPYNTRTATSVVNAVMYIINTYGSKPALFRDSGLDNRPVFYFFASNDTSDTEWAAAWTSIRKTSYDSIVIADTLTRTRVLNGGWDGFYNYFPGIDKANWSSHASWAETNNKIFIPPVGPGWDSTEVGGYGSPPIPRDRGAWYDNTWSPAITAASSSSLRYVAITSFNEWHEGTQIEPAVPKSVVGGRTYSDYLPDIPTMYIDKTASWAAVLDSVSSGKIQCEDYSGGDSAQQGVDYYDTTTGNSGGRYRSHNVDIQDCAEGGYNVGWIAPGEWLRYTNVQVSQTGLHEIRIRGAAWNSPGLVRVCAGSLSNPLLTISIPVTGGFQHWQTASGLVNLTAGSHTIYLYAENGDFNLNWFEIRPVNYAPNTPIDPGAVSISTNSIRWTWQDMATTETGFNIYADPGSATPTTLRGSTAADAAHWDYAGLTPNTAYSFQTSAFNAQGESGRTPKYTRYTMAGPPSIGNNVVCNKSVGVWYPAGTSFVFSNPVGFGAGTHGGNTYRVSKFTYAWNMNPTYTFTGSELHWLYSILGRSPNLGDGSYYLHLQSWNAEGVPHPTTVTYGPFNYESVAPVSSASLPEGVYNTGTTVSLTSNEPGVIYYTTNGSEPTTSSTVYSGPIALNADTTLRFFAVDVAGNPESPKKQVVYTIVSTETSIAQVRQLADAQQVRLGNKALYLKQSAFGYIEDQNRLSGIRIQGSIGAAQGQLVSLLGIMRKPLVGEAYVEISRLTPQGAGSVEPFGVSQKSLRDRLLDGMYIRSWGRVQPGSLTANSFIISDGSDETGTMVLTHVVPDVTEGAFVIIEGAAGDNGQRTIHQK